MLGVQNFLNICVGCYQRMFLVIFPKNDPLVFVNCVTGITREF